MTPTPSAAPDFANPGEYESDATRNDGLSFVGTSQNNISSKKVAAAEANLENFINMSKAHDNLAAPSAGKKKKKKRAQA